MRLLLALLMNGLVVLSPAVFADEPQPRLITVTGKAELMVVPDEIVISLALESTDTDLDSAKVRNDRTREAFFALIHEHDIPAEHVQLGYVSIRKEFNYYDGVKTFRGYKISRHATIRLKAVDRFEAVLHGVVAMGIDRVINVRLKSSDLREHKDEARILAVRAAREKAAAMAGELGAGLKQPYTIEELAPEIVPWRGDRTSNVMFEVEPSQVSGGDASALGQIPISAEVRVSFEMS